MYYPCLRIVQGSFGTTRQLHCKFTELKDQQITQKYCNEYKNHIINISNLHNEIKNNKIISQWKHLSNKLLQSNEYIFTPPLENTIESDSEGYSDMPDLVTPPPLPTFGTYYQSDSDSYSDDFDQPPPLEPMDSYLDEMDDMDEMNNIDEIYSDSNNIKFKCNILPLIHILGT